MGGPKPLFDTLPSKILRQWALASTHFKITNVIIVKILEWKGERAQKKTNIVVYNHPESKMAWTQHSFSKVNIFRNIISKLNTTSSQETPFEPCLFFRFRNWKQKSWIMIKYFHPVSYSPSCSAICAWILRRVPWRGNPNLTNECSLYIETELLSIDSVNCVYGKERGWWNCRAVCDTLWPIMWIRNWSAR